MLFTLPRLFPLLLLALASWAEASPAAHAFLDQYCIDCHDGDSKKGGLDFTALNWDLQTRGNFDEWVKVFDRVSKGEMPPKKKARPEPDATKAFATAIGDELRATDVRREKEIGRTVLRRLNRMEYERTVQDLLGIEIPLATLLPADTPMYGFDTVAEGLRFSTLQMEKYLEAADVALDAAINFGPQPESIKGRYYFNKEEGIRKHLDTVEGTLANPNDPKSAHKYLMRELPEKEAVVFFNEGYPSAEIKQIKSHPAGTYRIRVSAFGFQSKGAKVPVRVYSDNYREKILLGWFDMTPDEPRVVEWTAKLRANDFLRLEPSYTGLDDKGQNVYFIGAKTFTGSGLALQWLEIEGPLEETWPPKSMTDMFGDIPLVKIEDERKDKNKKVAYELKIEDPKASAKQAIEQFATRAFRRPLDPGEADRFIKLANDELDFQRPFLDALRIAYRAILTAPQFLLFQERPGKLDDYALAARLSYFLWSSMPDETLLQLAAQKKLSQPDVLRGQVERLLKDERSHGFVENFTGQWLDLRNIDATTPDKKLYPETDELLIVSMVQETEAFFAELLKRDLKITNVVQSDFAMLNSRLAAHYGISGVDTEEFRPVPLPPDSPRGGIITQASVLKVTANGTTTSPVLRGAWVMKKILGQPPAPPPAGVGSIEPDTRGATTVREQLAKHRNSETCAGCHANIDPPGFALESFDVIGGYRDRYRSQDKGDQTTVKNSRSQRQYIKLGPAVDASGEMSDGRPFTGIQDFKKLLLANPHQLVTALTSRVVTYSTGAGIGFADRDAVEAIATKVEEKGGGVRTLINEVVQSSLFQSK